MFSPQPGGEHQSLRPAAFVVGHQREADGEYQSGHCRQTQLVPELAYETPVVFWSVAPLEQRQGPIQGYWSQGQQPGDGGGPKPPQLLHHFLAFLFQTAQVRASSAPNRHRQ